ncbi:glycoside hydrolase family 3 protein [Peribacillus cavernae]|uniref:beta-N-acetylhexosaminidase n=1 Tax=Peribacillus cavernae TaxID=1674310 RepID=A0A3S0TS10_9BACI|nr:glycoside hydrolase family 3 protein [Peribacillus cavernae]MDQ0219884.1 beta-N-acetylhexosaminidase [Peribacillus cavernae]RUQ26631.1 glycoside hydrolase family 3 protein [Peribacillus cavernae]
MIDLRKTFAIPFLIAGLLFTQLFATAKSEEVKAERNQGNTDVIIYQNLPEIDSEMKDGQTSLKVLRIHEQGHFSEVTEGLTWKSANKNVARVDENGKVTLTGKSGRTFITVRDGAASDRIGIEVKGDSVPKKKGKPGKPASEVSIVKQKGIRYNIIEKAIDGLTVEEKVGQMLMPDFRTYNGKNVTEMLPEIDALVKKYHLGGVILFRENVDTTEQTARLVADYQDSSEKFGILLSIDQEGGIVTRLQSGTDFPGNMALGATRSEEITRKVGNAIGEELNSLGINTNFAPVFDVNNNPDNPVIGVRSFGEDPELVAKFGVAYTQGLQESGVSATAKHFPGHGDTAVDSHLGLPEVPHDKERLKEVELYPFQKAMDAGIDAIMTAHVTFPKIDDTKAISKKDGTEIAVPATLSYKVLTELMREEMGFDGVITTDALNMNAIADHFGAVDAAIRAVKAGSDLVLMPVGLEAVAEGLLKTVKTGEIPEERINASVKRILTLKVKRGIFKSESSIDNEKKMENARQVVGSEQHKQVEREAAERSITLVKNDNALPLNLDDTEKVVVVGNTYLDPLAQSVQSHHSNTTVMKASNVLAGDQLDELKSASAVIIGTYTFNVSGRASDSAQMKMVNQIIEEVEAPVIALGIRNPYDIMAFPKVDAYLAQYSFRTASFEASAKTIFGKNNPTGKLPVTIPGNNGNALYPFGHGLSY